MRSPFLAVACVAINIFVGTITSINGVEGLGAIFAFEAFAMPFASFGQHQFSSKDGTTTTRTTLARWSFDRGSIGYRCLGSMSLTKEMEQSHIRIHIKTCLKSEIQSLCLSKKGKISIFVYHCHSRSFASLIKPSEEMPE